jgi:hypothetical protein
VLEHRGRIDNKILTSWLHPHISKEKEISNMAAPFQPDADIIAAFSTCGLDETTRDRLLQSERLNPLETFAELRIADIQLMVDGNRKRTDPNPL